jgi:hypothetical protein
LTCSYLGTTQVSLSAWGALFLVTTYGQKQRETMILPTSSDSIIRAHHNMSLSRYIHAEQANSVSMIQIRHDSCMGSKGMWMDWAFGTFTGWHSFVLFQPSPFLKKVLELAAAGPRYARSLCVNDLGEE